MGMSMTQKILAAHAGKSEVKAGELITVKIDMALANDITAPIAIKELEKAGVKKIFNKECVALVMDHFAPNKDIASARQCKLCREFARNMGISNFYDVGQMGIEHALLPEKGLVAPGELIIGADSHTCTYGALGAFSTGIGSTDLAYGMAAGEMWLKVPKTLKFNISGSLNKWCSGKDIILYIIGKIGVSGALYKSMEFAGEGIRKLSMDDRFCICNMVIEAGAKNGIFPVDEQTRAYLDGRVERSYTEYTADENAEYECVYEITLDDIRPQVALPHSPENVHPAEEVGDIQIDQVVIGSCTNGRIADMAQAAEILAGRKVAKNVRAIVIPATQAIYEECLNKGYMKIFIEAGCAVSTPTCGPCLGGHMGILAGGERCVATTNRNFVGRMGDTDSEVYLAGPYVAAASAVAGRICVPEQL